MPNPKKEPDPDKPPMPPLHIQISGVWEPETLHPDTPAVEVDPNYFSVRGEVIFQNKDEGWLTVKVVQKPKKGSEKPMFNKIRLEGFVDAKAVKSFWEFDCSRDGQKLVIQDGRFIKSLKPPKPKSEKGKFTKGQTPVPKKEKPAPVTKPVLKLKQ
ncbi:MAG: hypothetical protein NVS2B14_00620 [Chamaesiphon sp.]